MQRDATLPSHFKRKGYLSVTELTSPSWCEFAYQYAHLLSHSNGHFIITPQGQTLTPSLAHIEEADKVKKQGTLIHAVLEAQAQPPGPKVEVKTLTREDEWALRLLNLWCNLRWLKENGTVREVQVWGWINGVFIRGVIDQIQEQKSLEQQKTWQSQQDWKKDHQWNKCTQQAATLDRFGFAAPKTAKKVEEGEVRYFISDTKMRVSTWMPEEEDQRSARMQCMLYKRLLGSMCDGSLDWGATFSHLSLDSQVVLSDAFTADAIPLAESWGLDLLSQNISTLATIASLLDTQLEKLNGHIQSTLTIVYTHQACFVKRHRPTNPRILGTVTFSDDPILLSNFLSDTLKMWTGIRNLRGVTEQQTRRCWQCAWKQGCEWRSQRATLHATKKQDEDLWSQLEEWDETMMNTIL